MSRSTSKTHKHQKRQLTAKPGNAARRAAQKSRQGQKALTATQRSRPPAHCVIARSESAVLSELLRDRPEGYDTSLIDQQSSRVSRMASASSSLSIAAGVAAATMAGFLSNLR